jgi:hypothetical protein
VPVSVVGCALPMLLPGAGLGRRNAIHMLL